MKKFILMLVLSLSSLSYATSLKENYELNNNIIGYDELNSNQRSKIKILLKALSNDGFQRIKVIEADDYRPENIFYYQYEKEETTCKIDFTKASSQNKSYNKSEDIFTLAKIKCGDTILTLNYIIYFTLECHQSGTIVHRKKQSLTLTEKIFSTPEQKYESVVGPCVNQSNSRRLTRKEFRIRLPN